MKLSPKLNLPIPGGSDIHNLTNFVALLNAIDNNAAPLGTMNNHIDNKNNPHAVTKAQVGLGQVNNVPQYSKTEMDSKLAELSKASQLPADSFPPTSTPASYPTGVTVMTVTTGYPGATTNSPKTVMTVRGSVDRGSYQLLIGSNDSAPQNRIYDGTAWGAWSTIATTLSNVASATRLANTRRIGGVAFDGTSDITLPGVNAPGNQPTSGKAATAGRADNATHADNATATNKLTTPRKIGGVAFDGSQNIDLPGVNTAGNQDTTGKAATAGRADNATNAIKADNATYTAQLATARTIAGVSFDGTADIAIPAGNVGAYTKSQTDAKDAATLASAKSYADTHKQDKLADTGWVKVTLMNGCNGDISVRLRDGVIYHKGCFWGSESNSTLFKYPDNFADMSYFGKSNSGWVAFVWDGNANNGYIKGATKEFCCSKVTDRSTAASVSHITFKL